MRKNILILVILFIFSLVLLVWTSAKYYRALQAYVVYSNAVEHTHQVVREILSLGNYLKDAETSQRGYLITKDSAFLEPLILFSDEIAPTFQRLGALTKDNPIQQHNLDTLRLAINLRNQKLRQVITRFQEGKPMVSEQFAEGNRSMAQCRLMLQRMESEELRLLQIRSALKSDYEDTTTIYSISSAFIGLLILLVSFIFIVREISRRISYQDTLELKIRELDQMTSELEQIAFVVAHDLQEPLRKMRTFADIFSRKYSARLQKEDHKIIERVNSSSLRMQGLVEDLMTFTSLSFEKKSHTGVQLTSIVMNVVNKMQMELTEKKININFSYDLPVVDGNATHLSALFENLIDNAIKFSRPQSTSFISIVGEPLAPDELRQKFALKVTTKKFVKVVVRDNGIGFSNEFAHKIFVLFQRLHQQDATYEGKGIGLAIVKRIMTNHQGYVSASGELDVGAQFNLYFPSFSNSSQSPSKK